MAQKAHKKETHTRVIINQFISAQATREDRAIDSMDIKTSFKDNEKQFLINSMLESGYLVTNPDGKLWFNEKIWNSSIRKLLIQYSLILLSPLLIAAILYVLFF